MTVNNKNEPAKFVSAFGTFMTKRELTKCTKCGIITRRYNFIVEENYVLQTTGILQ